MEVIEKQVYLCAALNNSKQNMGNRFTRYYIFVVGGKIIDKTTSEFLGFSNYNLATFKTANEVTKYLKRNFHSDVQNIGAEKLVIAKGTTSSLSSKDKWFYLYYKQSTPNKYYNEDGSLCTPIEIYARITRQM